MAQIIEFGPCRDMRAPLRVDPDGASEGDRWGAADEALELLEWAHLNAMRAEEMISRDTLAGSADHLLHAIRAIQDHCRSIADAIAQKHPE